MNRFKKSQLKACLIVFSIYLFVNHDYASGQYYTDYIDPFIGSEGKGNVFVGPSCPYGMVKPGPDCDINSNSGYSPDTSKSIYGFSQIHVSGTGGGPKYGNVLLMPFGEDFQSVNMESLRKDEITKAGYYSVLLKKWNIKVELTASPKVAVHRYTFPENATKGVKLDLGAFLGEEAIPNAREAQQFVGSEVDIINDQEARGYTRIRGGWNNGKAYTVYFYAVFNTPFKEYGTWKNSDIMPSQKFQFDEGTKTGAFFFFDENSTDTILVKIGISFISSLKAKENINNEVPEWNFGKLVVETQTRWENLLSRIEIDPSTSDEQKTMFYTALYHTMLMPVDRTGENPLWISDKPYYDDFYAIWDTYRSSHPLITLIDPQRQTDIVNALIDIYKYDGYMPDARSGNCNGRTQGGSNADVLIADAYVKELKGINYGQAFKAMLKNATVPPGGNEENEGRGGLTDYNRLGYVSTSYVRSGNRTLEYAYNDFCIAQVAKGMGRMGEYRRFIDQSNNWQNLWRDIEDNSARGFIMPKDPSGNWVDSIQCDLSHGRQVYTPYTPLAQEWPVCVCWWCGFFYEGTSWEYSFLVPHDVKSIIEKSGGKDAFRRRLDTFFENDYYNVSNEPSFLTPCLYHWIGRPDLSSDRINEIIHKNFNSSRQGLPGNDDSGAMSSWLAFHMMGLYPNAGQSYYLLHTPSSKKTVIHLGQDKEFTITAKNLTAKNKYIKSASLNGENFNHSWIEHREIIKGGQLILQMDDKPSEWGANLVPPSTK